MVYQNGKAIAMSFPSSGGAYQDIYSTEETVIGRWIDGKPLYRRVIQATTPSTASNGTSEILHFDIDIQPVSFSGYLIKIDDQIVPIPVYDNVDQYIYVAYNASNHALPNSLRCKVSNLYTNRPIAIILEYTKTTDQATTLSGQNSISFNLGNQAMLTAAVTASIASTESVEFEDIEDEDA